MRGFKALSERWLIKRNLLAVSALGLMLVLAAVLGQCTLGSQRSTEGVPTFIVRKGPMTISVIESGAIRARHQAIIKSEVEGKTTILFLEKEGALVRSGDLLIELDASRLQDALVDQQIIVQNAEAALIHSQESLEVTRNQAQSDVEKAKLKLQFAAEDLKNYREGEFPKQLKEAKSRISVAREELRRVEDRLGWSRVLFVEKYISQMELQADELAAQKVGLELELASDNRDLLQNFTYTRRLVELQSDLDQSRMAQDRGRRKAAADVIQDEAELRARESQHLRETGKLKKIKRQIEKTRILAPMDGMVVYATSTWANWRGNVEPLDEGQEVRERQELIYLPAAGAMIAEVKVHESSLTKVKVGLPVRVSVDALPGRSFRGRVNFIAPLPDAASLWLNPDLKLYNTEVYLDGESGELRTGMSCRAEILLTQLEEAVYVPVQAVTKVAGQARVYVVEGDRVETRAVKIGLDNNRFITIQNGLQAGEEVLLAPPFAVEGALGTAHSDSVASGSDRPSEPGAGSRPYSGGGGVDK